MKKSNLLILICFLLYSIGAYAQHNNPNTERYNDGEIDFEFVPELIYDIDNNGVDGELIGAKITVTNIGSSFIHQDIVFRVHKSAVVPSELPDSYNVEEVLSLSRHPLPMGGSEDIVVNFFCRSREKVITIWPVVESDRPIERQYLPYVTIVIPPIKTTNKKNLADHTSGIKMYPNPTYKNLHIEIPKGYVADQINIYDRTGQQVRTFRGTKSGLIVLDLDGLSPDMYFVAIRNEGGQIIHHSKILHK